MKFSNCVAALAITIAFANGQLYELYGDGVDDFCADGNGDVNGGGFWYDNGSSTLIWTIEECDEMCRRSSNYGEGLRGFSYLGSSRMCTCHYDAGLASFSYSGTCTIGSEFDDCVVSTGSGPIGSTYQVDGSQCFRYMDSAGFPVPPIALPPDLRYIGVGVCIPLDGGVGLIHDYTRATGVVSWEDCYLHCQEYPEGLRAFNYGSQECYCWYDDGYAPGGPEASQATCPMDRVCTHDWDGTGPIIATLDREEDVFGLPSDIPSTMKCWAYASSADPPSFMYELVGDGVGDACQGLQGPYDLASSEEVWTIEECDQILTVLKGGSGQIINSIASTAGSQCYRYKESVGFPVPMMEFPGQHSGLEFVGNGLCTAPHGGQYHEYTRTHPWDVFTLEKCALHCQMHTRGLRGLTYNGSYCYCWYDDGYAPGGTNPIVSPVCPDDRECWHWNQGSGEIIDSLTQHNIPAKCWKYTSTTLVIGDPHFHTWQDEHFEFHGQCDIVMTKVANFADQEGLDLEIHIRTKIVRHWSYIETAAIRIGNDILEVEGSAAKEDGEDKRHYHINYEYRGPLETLGGFQVTISPRNNKYIIDLGSKYPGQKIEINTFKEFVGVKIIGATDDSFGDAVGIMGDFKTGKTVARDGHTVLNDFNDLGLEWQVLPSDGKLFHEVSPPQFPELCYLPENPRGERTRRLAESSITEEAAEAACANLEDEFERKSCVYDVLATQDLDMVGAY